MTLYHLFIVPLFSAGPRVLAWCVGNKIYIRRPFDRILFAKARLAHEVWHVREDVGNEAHHPWWHFCVCVGHALRFRLVHG